MVTRLFPVISNTLYSQRPFLNAGKDPILELSRSGPHMSNIVIAFDFDEVSDAIPQTGSWTATLTLIAAVASGIDKYYSITIDELRHPFAEGTGQFLDEPNPQTGSNWLFANTFTSDRWSDAAGLNDGALPDNQTLSVPLFAERSIDFNVDVTTLLQTNLTSGQCAFVLHSIDVDDPNAIVSIKYFSEDTHTVYKPVLTIKTEDSIHNPILDVIENDSIQISLAHNPVEIALDTIVKINVGVKNKYPKKSYATVYTNDALLNLNETSYWALRDAVTGEVVISTSDGTKISSDGEENYFYFNSKNLYVNRYYRFELFIEVGNYAKRYSPDYIFKVHG